MALAPIANVSITLNTVGVTRAGFGTPLFLAAGNFFTGLTAAYASIDEVAEVFPVDTTVYKAATAAFAQNPAPSTFKVGKIDCTSNFVPDIRDANNDVVANRTVTIIVTDDAGDDVTASYTTTGSDDETDVTAALVTQIDAASLNVDATDNTGDFDLVGTGGDEFTTTGITFLVFSGTGAATGSALVTELGTIRDYDDDWYALTYEGRDQVSTLALAAAVEAMNNPAKIFATCSAETDAINQADTQTGTDIQAQLFTFGYDRTLTCWHHDAANTYYELGLLGYNLPFDAGSVVWSNVQVKGFEAAQNPTTGQLLTTTQLNNLSARNCNVLVEDAGVRYNREGKVCSGEWIDNIRGRDNLQVDLQADLKILLVNQQGTKIPYNDKGIAQVKSVIDNRLYDYSANRGFIEPDYSISAPKASQVLAADKIARTLNDISFKAKLTGGIIIVDLLGTLEI